MVWFHLGAPARTAPRPHTASAADSTTHPSTAIATTRPSRGVCQSAGPPRSSSSAAGPPNAAGELPPPLERPAVTSTGGCSWQAQAFSVLLLPPSQSPPQHSVLAAQLVDVAQAAGATTGATAACAVSSSAIASDASAVARAANAAASCGVEVTSASAIGAARAWAARLSLVRPRCSLAS